MEWHDIFNVLKGTTHQLGYFIQQGYHRKQKEIKTFQEKQNLKVLMATKPVLHVILKRDRLSRKARPKVTNKKEKRQHPGTTTKQILKRV